MSQHVIVGAGAIGSTTATILAGRGESVRLVTRRGSGPEHPAIERVAADAGDADRLTGLTEGAVALYNCANPLYHQWFRDWPPIHAALLAAAERTGATLVTMSNLYGYGDVAGPITPRTPLGATHPKLKLRADMWRDALARHEAGKLRATEARASDYIEANSLLSYAMGKPMLEGKRVFSPAPLDVPHSWTSTFDAASTLATIATDERAWGKAWLVPTHEPLTVGQMAERFAEVAGAPAPRLSQVPWPVMWAYGLFDPMMKELRTTRYQFTKPFVIDSRETTATFGIEPRPLDETLKAAAEALRAA